MFAVNSSSDANENVRQEHEFAVKIARSAFQLTVQYLEKGKEKVYQDICLPVFGLN